MGFVYYNKDETNLYNVHSFVQIPHTKSFNERLMEHDYSYGPYVALFFETNYTFGEMSKYSSKHRTTYYICSLVNLSMGVHNTTHFSCRIKFKQQHSNVLGHFITDLNGKHLMYMSHMILLDIL